MTMKNRKQNTPVPPFNPHDDFNETDERGGGDLFEFSEENPLLIGTITGVEPFNGKFGETERYAIMDDDGKLWAVIAPTVLAQKLSGTPVGYRVKVQYAGKKRTGKGFDVELYRVWTKAGTPVATDSGKTDDLPF